MNLLRHDVLDELRLSKAAGRRFARKDTLAAIYSRTVSSRTPLSEVVTRHFPWCRHDLEEMQTIFARYAERKRALSVLDYDDLLLFWGLLAAAPQVGELVAGRFQHILVDEYQDTNIVQAEILRAMRRTCRNLMVVGDDAQAIFSFRAATVRNLLDFPRHFPDAALVTLEHNYRSLQPILSASNAVMAEARERFTKNLFSLRPSPQRPLLWSCLDEAQQSEQVCCQVLAHREQGIPLRRQAVLFRSSHHSDHLEVELGRRNLPFVKFGGLRFLEAAHVKDLLSMLRVLENPRDEISWFRLLQLLPGVGPRHAAAMVEALGVGHPAASEPSPPGATPGATRGKTASETPTKMPGEAAHLSPLRRLLLAPPPVPKAAQAMFGELRQAFADCLGTGTFDQPAAVSDGTPPLDAQAAGDLPRVRDSASPSTNSAPAGEGTRGQLPLASQVERLRRWYAPLLEQLHDHAAIRMRDLEQLEQIAAGYRSRAQFLSDLALDPPSSTSDLAGQPLLDDDYLILSTIHSAKGCEWDVVHVIHAVDGNIPSDMATGDADEIEEERRLFYVALTRARDWLYVYCPLRYYHTRRPLGDAHGLAQPTRFISAAVRPFFEARATAAEAAEESATQAPAPGDIGQTDGRRAVEEMLAGLFRG
jgi:DNA helicase-2/ATP-dependent DNA helicase PcrA